MQDVQAAAVEGIGELGTHYPAAAVFLQSATSAAGVLSSLALSRASESMPVLGLTSDKSYTHAAHEIEHNAATHADGVFDRISKLSLPCAMRRVRTAPYSAPQVDADSLSLLQMTVISLLQHCTPWPA